MLVGNPHEHEYACDNCGNTIPAFLVESRRDGSRGSVLIHQRVMCTSCNPHGLPMQRRKKRDRG